MYKLTIQNFQSIEKLEIVLNGFSTLVGKSNRGKSAIVRALRAILCNEWNPSYLKEGTKECVLTFEVLEKSEYLKNLLPDFDIQKIVLRKPINEYIVYKEDGTKLSYPKVGKGVPDVFSNIALSEIVTEREDSFNLTFQAQLDPLFLITATDVEVSSFINKVFDIARFERALRDMASDDIKLSKLLSDTENSLPLLQDSLDVEKGYLEKDRITLAKLEEKLSDTEKLKQEYEASRDDIIIWEGIQTHRDLLQQKEIEIFSLGFVSGVIAKMKDTVEVCKNVSSDFATYTNTLQSAVEIEALLSPCEKQRDFVSSAKESLNLIYEYSAYEETRLAAETCSKEIDATSFVCNTLSEIKGLMQEYANLSDDLLNIQNYSMQVVSANVPYEANKVVGEFFGTAKNYVFGNIKECPLCKKPMSGDTCV